MTCPHRWLQLLVALIALLAILVAVVIVLPSDPGDVEDYLFWPQNGLATISQHILTSGP